MSKRKICVITGSRAEYGLLSSVMREIIRNNELELQIIATGMHMSPEFGLTYSEIESDGFEINEKIEMLLSASTATAVVKSMGLATISFADSFQKLKPDVLLVLGDRFEILSAVQVALLMNIPIAHISGGELTEGAIDDSIRHAITKMSHIHYAATEEYAKRIIQMGEQPHAVINVGDLGVSNIKELNLISQGQLSEFFGFDIEGCLLVTFHPTTIEFDTAAEHMKSLLSALDHFPEYKVIITKSNADAEGRIINELIDEYALKHPDRVSSHTSLGRLRYLSTMKYCAAVIGNSSSGIIEAPVFQKPTVNIGNRQKGRLRAESIIDCSAETDKIVNAIGTALSEAFQAELSEMSLKHDGENVALKITNHLMEVNLKDVLVKKFNDI